MLVAYATLNYPPRTVSALSDRASSFCKIIIFLLKPVLKKTASVQRSAILPSLFFKELRIGAALPHQLVMMPLLGDSSVFQDINGVSRSDR
jgi:hypothetical protein